MNTPHLLGQPFTISNLAVPVNATLTCNCAIAHGGPPTELPVVASAPVTCPLCQTVYLLAFEVAGKLSVATAKPETKEPS